MSSFPTVRVIGVPIFSSRSRRWGRRTRQHYSI